MVKTSFKKILPVSIIFTLLILFSEVLSFSLLYNVYYDQSELSDFLAIPIILIGTILSVGWTWFRHKYYPAKFSLLGGLMTFILSVIGIFIIVLLLPVPLRISQSDTIYTNQFSFDKFDQITIGMSKSEVEQLIGQPFEVKNYTDECWQYSQIKTSWSDFLGWQSIMVCFNKLDKVTAKPINVFFD